MPEKAMFYWDYDVFYTRLPLSKKPPYTHEAGEFILRNLKLFPNQLPETSFDVLRKPKNVRFYLRFYRKCTSPLLAAMD